MKNICSFIGIIAVILLSVSCSNMEKQDKSEAFLTLDKLYEQSDSLSEKTVRIQGQVDHVCRSTQHRFKILGPNHTEIRVEIDPEAEGLDSTIIGKTAFVSGKLVPVPMDSSRVRAWEKHVLVNHAHELESEHVKHELEEIRSILAKIESGEIPHHTTYYLEAVKYEFE
jgi:hypothetical protein